MSFDRLRTNGGSVLWQVQGAGEGSFDRLRTNGGSVLWRVQGAGDGSFDRLRTNGGGVLWQVQDELGCLFRSGVPFGLSLSKPIRERRPSAGSG